MALQNTFKVSQLFERHTTKFLTLILLGAVVLGGVLGSFILPGVGTVFGGVLGASLGLGIGVGLIASINLIRHAKTQFSSKGGMEYPNAFGVLSVVVGSIVIVGGLLVINLAAATLGSFFMGSLMCGIGILMTALYLIPVIRDSLKLDLIQPFDSDMESLEETEDHAMESGTYLQLHSSLSVIPANASSLEDSYNQVFPSILGRETISTILPLDEPDELNLSPK